MICGRCSRSSLHVRCPFCRPAIAGFDLPNPFSYAYDLGHDLGSSASSSLSSTSPSDSSSGGLGEKLSSIPNPFSYAYDTGKNIGSDVSSSLSQPIQAATSLANTVRYLMIGGAILGAGIVIYMTIKFLPHVLDVAAGQAKMGTHAMGKLVSKGL
jgi:hypothetical protein